MNAGHRLKPEILREASKTTFLPKNLLALQVHVGCWLFFLDATYFMFCEDQSTQVKEAKIELSLGVEKPKANTKGLWWYQPRSLKQWRPHSDYVTFFSHARKPTIPRTRSKSKRTSQCPHCAASHLRGCVRIIGVQCDTLWRFRSYLNMVNYDIMYISLCKGSLGNSP